MKHIARTTVAALSAGAIALTLAACGSTSQSTGESKDGGATEILVWSWEPTVTPVVKAFEKKHPEIKVKLVNAGTNKDEYTALNNALEAGSGYPDVVQIETHALPEYVYKNQLKDLSDFGAKDYDGFYMPGIWSSVQINDGIYGLPMGAGPMAMFYNKEVFDKAGVTEVPTTWDEYYEAAKKIRAVGSYITTDGLDAGQFDSFWWQAGGQPYAVDGENVTIDLTGDENVKKVNDYWQKMIDEDLVLAGVTGWTDDWNRGLNDGSIATLLAGAWMPATLVNVAPDGAGKWRVAQTPGWSEGDTSNCEHGGSTLAMVEGIDEAKAKAAWTFMDFVSHDEEAIEIRRDNGAFPDDNGSLEDPGFLEATTLKNSAGEDIEYFGGQKFNEEFATAAANVKTKFENLPYEVYARGKFGDYVGYSRIKDSSIADGVAAWQKDLTDYGNSQGFTVKN